MLNLEALDFVESILFVLLEALVPIVIEVLHKIFSDVDIFAHLGVLDVGTELVLSSHDLALEESNFLHEVLVKLILMDLTALISKQLHFLLDNLEDHDLLILVQHGITTLIEHFNEFSRSVESQKVNNMLSSLFIDKSDVSLIKDTFLSEISLLDSLPDLFALPCTSNQWPGLSYKSIHLVSGHIGQ